MEIDIASIMLQSFALIAESMLETIKATLSPGLIIGMTLFFIPVILNFFIKFIISDDGPESTMEFDYSYTPDDLEYSEDERLEILAEYKDMMDIYDSGLDLDFSDDDEDSDDYYRQWAKE